MIKLTNILNEIKINAPVYKKKDILDFILNESDLWVWAIATHYSSETDLLSDQGYDSIKDFLIYEWSQFSDDDETLNELGLKTEQYIDAYYRIFKPKEIHIEMFGDKSGANIKSDVSYKNIIINYEGEGYYSVYCNNY